MGSRRRFTKEFKQSVVQQLDSISPAEICREQDIHQNMLHRWRKEYESKPTVIEQIMLKRLFAPIRCQIIKQLFF